MAFLIFSDKLTRVKIRQEFEEFRLLRTRSWHPSTQTFVSFHRKSGPKELFCHKGSLQPIDMQDTHDTFPGNKNNTPQCYFCWPTAGDTPTDERQTSSANKNKSSCFASTFVHEHDLEEENLHTHIHKNTLRDVLIWPTHCVTGRHRKNDVYFVSCLLFAGYFAWLATCQHWNCFDLFCLPTSQP